MIYVTCKRGQIIIWIQSKCKMIRQGKITKSTIYKIECVCVGGGEGVRAIGNTKSPPSVCGVLFVATFAHQKTRQRDDLELVAVIFFFTNKNTKEETRAEKRSGNSRNLMRKRWGFWE